MLGSEKVCKCSPCTCTCPLPTSTPRHLSGHCRGLFLQEVFPDPQLEYGRPPGAHAPLPKHSVPADRKHCPCAGLTECSPVPGLGPPRTQRLPASLTHHLPTQDLTKCHGPSPERDWNRESHRHSAWSRSSRGAAGSLYARSTCAAWDFQGGRLSCFLQDKCPADLARRSEG